MIRSAQPTATDADATGGQPDILLRPWTEDDAVALRAAIDEDVAHLKPWLSWTLEEPVTLDRTVERLRSWIEQFRNGTARRYAVVPVGDPLRILGGVGLATRFGPDEPDISYWVRRSSARHGIARAAVTALTVHAFTVMGATRIVLQCDAGNDRSAAFARSLGFRFVERAVTWHDDGRPRPVLRFELARADFDDGFERTFRLGAQRVRLVGSANAI